MHFECKIVETKMFVKEKVSYVFSWWQGMKASDGQNIEPLPCGFSIPDIQSWFPYMK
jgi:hypothetical protein